MRNYGSLMGTNGNLGLGYVGKSFFGWNFVLLRSLLQYFG